MSDFGVRINKVSHTFDQDEQSRGNWSRKQISKDNVGKSRFLSGIPRLGQVPSVNRQSGGDEAKRIGLVGRLHLSICGRVGGRGRICIKHLYCCPSQPFCCGACSADLPVIASLELFLKERHTSNSKTGMGDLDTPNSKTGNG